jgi:hypothetical protein
MLIIIILITKLAQLIIKQKILKIFLKIILKNLKIRIQTYQKRKKLKNQKIKIKI